MWVCLKWPLADMTYGSYHQLLKLNEAYEHIRFCSPWYPWHVASVIHILAVTSR